MPALADTAYPRLRVSPDEAELSDAFTPTPDELAFAVKRTRQPGPRLALLVMLKTFQRLGHFARPDDVPPTIVAHIAAATALGDAVAEFDAYGTASSYRSRLMTLVRDYVGVAAHGPPARKAATVAAIEVSRGRDDLADIVNAAIEELARRRFELPAFSVVKSEPERPSPARMRAFLLHLRWLREQTADNALAGIPGLFGSSRPRRAA